MNPDDMKQAWQMQTAHARLAINPDLLLAEFRRNERTFAAMIFCRDLREVGTALLLIPVWILMGTWQQSPWSWYLEIPALLWIAGFMLVDRRRHSSRLSPEEPLVRQVEVSLNQVEHQIWLLRNILWWYLLPLGLPMLVFFADVWRLFGAGWLSILIAIISFAITIGVVACACWLNRRGLWSALKPRSRTLRVLLMVLILIVIIPFMPFAVVIGVFGFVYWLNQHAVRTTLEPRRRELQALVEALNVEAIPAE